ncbi:MAG TPA: Crp/Fnr family transcriptional regulator [Candidatus Saccharimonadales bacterium]|nr:Crp/Fnr family transcriptional regulator [Candidatus Saccharimonadales bacterium]
MSTLTDLFKDGKTVHFKKKEFFITPKKEPLGIYQVTEGFIVSYSQSTTHKRRIQTILKKGDVFPLAWTINSNTVRHDMYIQAISDGSMQLVEKEVFIKYINTSHKAALDVIDILLVYLRTYVDRVENLEEDTVRQKLKNRLLFFVNRFGIPDGETIRIELPITHKLIAESINVSRENVTRELKILEKKKIISFTYRQLVIVDLQKLQEDY